MTTSRATNQTTPSSHMVQIVTSGQVRTQYLGACHASQASTTQRVQRGTNRPFGKMYKNRPKEADPRKLRTATGGHQLGCAAASAYMFSVKVAVANVSSARATNSAI